jgi:microsomal dipeptidase-like Zn-dependent dipeptidase
VSDTAARVKAVGAQHFVLGTDLGQAGNPTPADGLQMLVAGLMKEGITREQIVTMGRETPGALLLG